MYIIFLLLVLFFGSVKSSYAVASCLGMSISVNGAAGGKNVIANRGDSVVIRLRVANSNNVLNKNRFWIYDAWPQTSAAFLIANGYIPNDSNGGTLFTYTTTAGSLSDTIGKTKVLVNGFEDNGPNEPKFAYDANCTGSIEVVTAVPECKFLTADKAVLSPGQTVNLSLGVANGPAKGVVTVSDRDVINLAGVPTQVGASIESSSKTGDTYNFPITFETLASRGADNIQFNGYAWTGADAKCVTYLKLVLPAEPTSIPTIEPPKTIICLKSCSGTVCSNTSKITTCQYKEEHACYQTAECKLQTDGNCGWTQTSDLTQCIANARVTPTQPVAVPTKILSYVAPGSSDTVTPIDMGGECKFEAGEVKGADLFSSCPAEVLKFEGPDTAKVVKFYNTPANSEKSCVVMSNFYIANVGNMSFYTKFTNACTQSVNTSKCRPCSTRVSGYAGPGLNKGDANCDGIVSLRDYTTWKSEFYTSTFLPGIAQTTDSSSYEADMNCDSRVTSEDYDNVWLRNYSP